MDTQRRQLIERARRILKDIEQIFLDADYWNNHVRTPFEEPIDPDPGGELARYAAGLERMLAAEAGSGGRGNGGLSTCRIKIMN